MKNYIYKFYLASRFIEARRFDSFLEFMSNPANNNNAVYNNLHEIYLESKMVNSKKTDIYRPFTLHLCREKVCENVISRFGDELFVDFGVKSHADPRFIFEATEISQPDDNVKNIDSFCNFISSVVGCDIGREDITLTKYREKNKKYKYKLQLLLPVGLTLDCGSFARIIKKWRLIR